MYVALGSPANLNPPAALRSPAGAGLGLFESGLDFSQWSIGEWAAIVLGGYVLVSFIGDTKRTAKGVSRRIRRVGAKSRRRKQLQEELAAV